MTTTQLKISKQYRGNYFIAITQFERMYKIFGGFSKQELGFYLKRSKKELGSDFQTMQVYNGVNNLANNLLEKAIYRLNAGEKVDLERILV